MSAGRTCEHCGILNADSASRCITCGTRFDGGGGGSTVSRSGPKPDGRSSGSKGGTRTGGAVPRMSRRGDTRPASPPPDRSPRSDTGPDYATTPAPLRSSQLRRWREWLESEAAIARQQLVLTGVMMAAVFFGLGYFSCS